MLTALISIVKYIYGKRRIFDCSRRHQECMQVHTEYYMCMGEVIKAFIIGCGTCIACESGQDHLYTIFINMIII